MKISHVKGSIQTNFIEVRHYENSIVNISKDNKPTNSDFCIGLWRVKAINKVDNVYQMLADEI